MKVQIFLTSEHWILKKRKLLIIASLPLCLFFLLIVNMLFKSSFVYKESLKVAQQHSAIQNNIGSNVKYGFWVKGQVSEGETEGSGVIQLPISGSMGEGMIHGEAIKKNSVWKLEKTFLVLENGKKVSLEPLAKSNLTGIK